MTRMSAATIVAICELRQLTRYVNQVHPELSHVLQQAIQVAETLSSNGVYDVPGAE